MMLSENTEGLLRSWFRVCPVEELDVVDDVCSTTGSRQSATSGSRGDTPRAADRSSASAEEISRTPCSKTPRPSHCRRAQTGRCSSHSTLRHVFRCNSPATRLSPRKRSWRLRMFSAFWRRFTYERYLTSLMRRHYLEWGPEGWLGTGSHYSSLLHRVHVDCIQPGHQDAPPLSRVGGGITITLKSPCGEFAASTALMRYRTEQHNINCYFIVKRRRYGT